MTSKPLRIRVADGSFHIEGYPDAVALKQLKPHEARRLGGLTLHVYDLGIALAAVNSMVTDAMTPALTECMWTAALVTYFKCFGVGDRLQLSADKIFKAEPQARKNHHYFRQLRNNHIVHDVNAYSQTMTGVAINREGMDYKVADVLSARVTVQTAAQQNATCLGQLVQHALNWVTAERDALYDQLGSEYEKLTYAALAALPSVEPYLLPIPDEVGTNRVGEPIGKRR